MMNITSLFGKQSASGKAAVLFGAPGKNTAGESVQTAGTALQEQPALLAAVPEFLHVLLAQIQQSVQPDVKNVPQEGTFLGVKEGDTEGSSDAPPAEAAGVLFSGGNAGVEQMNVRGVTPLLQWNRSKLQSVNAKPAAAAETEAVTKLSMTTDNESSAQQPVNTPVTTAEVSQAVQLEAGPSVVSLPMTVEPTEPRPVIPDQFPAEAFRFPVTGNGVLFTDERKTTPSQLHVAKNIPVMAETVPAFIPAESVKQSIPEDGAYQGTQKAEVQTNSVPSTQPVIAHKEFLSEGSAPVPVSNPEAGPKRKEIPEDRHVPDTTVPVRSERISEKRVQTETAPAVQGRAAAELLNTVPAEQITVRKLSGTPEPTTVTIAAVPDAIQPEDVKSTTPVQRTRHSTNKPVLTEKESPSAEHPSKQSVPADASHRGSTDGSEQGAPQRERSGLPLPADSTVNNAGERPAPVPFEKVMAAPAVSADVRTIGRTATVAAPVEPAVVPSLLEQLSRNIDMAIKHDRSEMKLTLNPESLGEVVMRVHVEDGKVNASLDVQQPNVKHIIETNMPQLREALTAKGLTMERIEVTTAQQGTADEMAKQHQGGGKKKRQWNDVMEDEEGSMKTLGYNTIEITM